MCELTTNKKYLITQSLLHNWQYNLLSLVQFKIWSVKNAQRNAAFASDIVSKTFSKIRTVCFLLFNLKKTNNKQTPSPPKKKKKKF